MEGSIMASREVKQLSAQLWGLAVTEGVLAILAGVALLFWPGATATLLVSVFGLFVLIWGVVELVKSLISLGNRQGWWVQLIVSVLFVALGVYLLRNVGIDLAAFILLVGFTFIVRGLFDVLTGLFGRDDAVVDNKGLHVVLGVIGLVAGIVTLVQPAASGVAFIWVAGVYALVFGVFTIALAMKTQPE